MGYVTFHCYAVAWSSSIENDQYYKKTAQYNNATQINVWKNWKHVKNIIERLCYLV